MPKVFEKDGYKFFFFSNEGNPLEPLHIHIRKGEKLSKFWLKPNINLESNYGFNSKELNWIEDVIEQNLSLIEGKWNDFFSI
ncbi:MAG: DUF4160 domain-containing protein [Leptospiraceae bacterium]|nr:DUF4160 domain-containing protein [Leptospiraceae bacterium]